jgi:hypothetical protein
VSQATGIALLEGQGNSGTTVSFNELNSEVQQP